MKTSIKPLLASGLLAIVLSTSTVYASDIVKSRVSKTVAAENVDVAAIKKIMISGNVEVTLVQTTKAKVLYTNDSDVDVSVKKEDDALYIHSKNNQTAKITVYVTDIYRVSASDNAIVKTKDALNLKFLQVFSSDNAKVAINAKTEGIYTVVKGNSELKLTGYSDFHTSIMDKSSKITLEEFSALKTDMSNSSLTAYATVKN